MIKIFLYSAISLFFIEKASAYSINRTKYGATIRWSDSDVRQTLYTDYSNNHSISDDEVGAIVRDGVNQWRDAGSLNMSIVPGTSRGDVSNQNNIYFSKSPLYFGGGGVLAVTKTVHSSLTGRLLEADIIINNTTPADSFSRGMSFSSVPTETGKFYLGDVVTHELGHFLGLSHSQVMDSSMIYIYRRGSKSLFSDDVCGVQHIYGNVGNVGRIRGKVVGGDDLIGILGTHVKVISNKDGTVVGGVFTDQNGNFLITGLDLDDTYYLYIEPAKNLSAIPNYYSESRTDFCPGGASYRGGFYGSCNASEIGYPVGIHLSGANNSVNVGDISIACGVKTPTDYISNRETGFDLPAVDLNMRLGNAYTGFFSATEAANNTPNIINVDLSSVTIPSNNYYLDVKLIFQRLYSQVKMDVTVANIDTRRDFSVRTDSDGNPVLDIAEKIPLSMNSSKNDFTITITPTDFASYFLSSSRTDANDFFPGLTGYGDDTIIYFAIINVVKREGNSYVSYNPKRYTLSDNRSCPSGRSTYLVSADIEPPSVAQTLLGQKRGLAQEQEEAFTCGTVDFGGSGGSGPLSFVFGLLTALFIYPIRNTRFI